MGYDTMQLVMQGAVGVTGRCYTTLLVLARYADDDSGVCWPGQRAISFLARQSQRTTVWAIDELAKAGWIQIDRKAARAGCNRYTLDLDRMRSECVRVLKPRRNKANRSQNRPFESVENPVEELRISCGRVVEKASDHPVQSANSGIGIIKEKLEKYRSESKTEAAGTRCELSVPLAPLPDHGVPRVDVVALLERLVRAGPEEHRVHARAPDPPPLPSWA